MWLGVWIVCEYFNGKREEIIKWCWYVIERAFFFGAKPINHMMSMRRFFVVFIYLFYTFFFSFHSTPFSGWFPLKPIKIIMLQSYCALSIQLSFNSLYYFFDTPAIDDFYRGSPLNIDMTAGVDIHSAYMWIWMCLHTCYKTRPINNSLIFFLCVLFF